MMLARMVLATLLLSPPTLAAEDRPEDVLKLAIAAAGGVEVLDKYPAGRVVGKGSMTFAGMETEFTLEQAFHVPGKFRTVVRCEVKGQKWELLQIVNDGKARQTLNGKPLPLTDSARKELQTAALLNEIAQLTPLVASKRFAVKIDKQIKGAEAGLIVSMKGQPDFRCAFDRKSGQLVRIAYKEPDPETAKEVEVETLFDDFQAMAGLTRPAHAVVNRDGKKQLDLQVQTFTPLERIDPKAFAVEE